MPRNSKKLCIITNRYPAHPDDTASPFVKDFHLALKKRGVQVLVHTPAYLISRVNLPPSVYRFNWYGGDKTVGELNLFSVEGMSQLISFLRQGRQSLFELIARERPDHCLALWALPSGWFAYQVMKEFGIPYSTWCLGSDIYVWAKKPVFRRLTKTVLNHSAHLFADGFELADKVGDLAKRNCTFLPSQRLLPDEKAGSGSPLERRFQNFLFLGRWEKSKGLADLLTAMRTVVDQNPKARLHILGWGPFESEMKSMVAGLNLESFVKIIGKVDTPTLSSYLKNCDWVVIPSRGDSIPLVLSEALQFKKPVVVTDVGDLGTLTRDYHLGKVAPPGDPDKMAQAMLESSREKENYAKRMPEVLELLSVRRSADKFLETLSWKPPLAYPQRASRETAKV